MPGPWIGVCFRELADTGWTSIYFPTGTGSNTYPGIFNAVDAVNSKEMALYPPAVQCPWIRVSDLSVRGDAKLDRPSSTIGTWHDVDPQPNNAVADASLAVPVRMESQFLRRTTKYLRGLPLKFVNAMDRATFTPDQTWLAPWMDWQTAVVNAFAIMNRKVVQGAPTVFTPYTITSIPSWPLVGVDTPGPVVLTMRRTGRPFDLRRGRRATC